MPKRLDPLAESLKHESGDDRLSSKYDLKNVDNGYKLVNESDRLYQKLFISQASSQQLWRTDLPFGILQEEQSLLTFERLNELPYLEEDEDYTRPTQYAFSSAYQLILRTRDILFGSLPDAFLMTTEKGGVEFYWKKPSFSLKVTIASSPNGTDYIYVREAGVSRIEKEVSPSVLATLLREYVKRNQ